MPLPERLPEAERSALEGICDTLPVDRRACPVCGAPLTGRRRSACSDRCRAALSRQKRATADAVREQRLRELVRQLADMLHMPEASD